MRSVDKNGLDKAAGSNATVEIKTFQPRNFGSEAAAPVYESVKREFGSLANTDRNSNPRFQLNAAAKKLLGVEAEELSHIEDRVQAEVQERLTAIEARAYAEGFEKGQRDGLAKAEQDSKARFEPMIEQLGKTMQSLDQIKQELYSANERVLIQLIFNIAKEVLLRELKADPFYVKRLTLAVIEKIGAKDSVRIRFNREDFANAEEIRAAIKSEFPELKNISIEPSEDLDLGGCKVETDLSRINAAVETQLKAIETSLHEA